MVHVVFRLRNVNEDEALALRETIRPGEGEHDIHAFYQGAYIRFEKCAWHFIPDEFLTSEPGRDNFFWRLFDEKNAQRIDDMEEAIR